MAPALRFHCRAEIIITDEEIETYWDNSKSLLVDDLVNTTHILVKTEEKAREILLKLKGGKAFEAMAKQYSNDSTSKERGGNLGWLPRKRLVKEFADVAFALRVGEVSAPVKTQFGYHIIRVEGIKNKEDQSLEEHREHIRHNIQRERWLKVLRKDWIASIKAQSKIWNKLNNL